ncbi:MAG: hypothetical protein M0P71_17005 [Melioribacteraceae bacterium]|nr:hypothetical protein [Melioribacteraceae bacterium]
MDQVKKYYQLIPEKVFQSLNTIEDLMRPGIKGFSIDNLKEVISIVACHVRNEVEPAQLQMKYIKKLVPQGDKYLLGLIHLGIIQRSGIASEKQKISYLYNFSPEYQSKYKSIPLNNAKLILRIEKAHETFRKKESAKSIRGHSEQTKYLKQLTITDGFNEFIESTYSAETDQYNSVLGSATRIINKDISYSVDTTSGRFHSNITNMAKGLRPFLRINGEPLVNIDIKNSQPYLSTILLTDPGKVSWMTKNPAFAMLLQTLNVSLSQDVKIYISLVISGQLYEYLMSEFSKEGLHLTRIETKRQVLRILFARNRMPRNPINDTEVFIYKLTEKEKRKREEFIRDYPKIKKTRQIFIKLFPKVHRIFSKVRGHEKGDKFQNFKRFAILLQRIESYLMLDVILKRIYKELPGTIAVTVHDSIMTGILTNNVEAVHKIITEELTFFVGFAPKIEIEGIIKENKEEEERNKEERERIIYNQYVATNLATLN